MKEERQIDIECWLPPTWEKDKLVEFALSDLKISLEDNEHNLKNWYVSAEIVQYSTEEYSIRLNEEDKTKVLVSCSSVVGFAYAIFYISKLIRIKEIESIKNKLVSRAPDMELRLDFIHENPGETPCRTQYRSIKNLIKLGYNGVVVRNFASLVLYDSYKVKLYDEGTPERALIIKNREEFKGLLEVAKTLHMKVFLYGDVLTLPYTVTTKGLDLFHDKSEGQDNPFYRDSKESNSINPIIPERELFCIGKYSVMEVYQTGLIELFEDFPELDGIIVRTGENYVQSDPTLMGNNLLDGKCNCCCSLSEYDRHRLIITKTKEITEKYKRLYIHRTWDFNGFHHLKKYYLDVVDSIEPSLGLIFSIKHTETDFWRYVRFNPCIGEGSHRQLMEFQCQREYEGKGAFPNYLGRIFKNGQQEVTPAGSMKAGYDKGLKAVWSWSRGGGWNGPYLKDEVWVNANVYAFISLAWDTCADPVAIAREWAAFEFNTPYDSPFTEGMAEILIDSEDAVKKIFYFDGFCKNNPNPWGPNLFWARDDDLTDRGINKIANYYINTKGIEGAIDEKNEAQLLCLRMLKKMEEIKPYVKNTKKYEIALNTIKYLDSFSKVVKSFFSAVLLYYLWLEGFEYNTRLGMQVMNSVNEWEYEWNYFNYEISKLEGVASLFEDVGFSGIINSMKSHLAHHIELDFKGSHWGFEAKNRERALSKI